MADWALVDFVIEKAADPGPAQAGGLRREVQGVADDPSFPVQGPAVPGLGLPGCARVGDDGEGDAGVCGEGLAAMQLPADSSQRSWGNGVH